MLDSEPDIGSTLKSCLTLPHNLRQFQIEQIDKKIERLREEKQLLQLGIGPVPQLKI